MHRVIHRVPLALVAGPPALLSWDSMRKHLAVDLGLGEIQAHRNKWKQAVNADD